MDNGFLLEDGVSFFLEEDGTSFLLQEPPLPENMLFPAIPSSLAWDLTIAPLFDTLVQESVSGREVTNALQLFPRWEIVLKYVILRNDPNGRVNGMTALETLANFYGSHYGAGISFLFNLSNITKRSVDSVITDQVIGTGDGSTRAFQLVRPVLGILDICQEPQNQQATVKVNGVTKTQGTDYTISKGVVTFGAAPALTIPITASFTALWRCRFHTNESQSKRGQTPADVTFRQFYPNLFDCQSVSLITVKQ